MKTEWEENSKWYHELVGEKGHYYHEYVIFPQLLPLLDFELYDSPSLLDLGCGQGVLAHQLPHHVQYSGVDLSFALIAEAKRKKLKNCDFFVADASLPLPIGDQKFTHATFILSLQNMQHPQKALEQAAKHLITGGVLIAVLNHPCFRIPRLSHWGHDEHKGSLYRRLDHYLSPLKIPIQTNPSKNDKSTTTWTFHHSLSDYTRFLAEAGFVTLLMQEWVSDKKSTGKYAKMENTIRKEFPLFLTLVAQKIL